MLKSFSMEEKIVLTKLNEEELIDFLSKYDDKKFRINQIINWIYNKSASSFDEMTDVKKELREKLKNEALITDVKIKTKQVSKDGTIKYLLEYIL